MTPTLRKRICDELSKGPASQHELSERLVVSLDQVRSTVFQMNNEVYQTKNPDPVIGTADGKALQLNPEISLGNGQVPSR